MKYTVCSLAICSIIILGKALFIIIIGIQHQFSYSVFDLVAIEQVDGLVKIRNPYIISLSDELYFGVCN